jgi:excisionase family DNA binding protein
MTERPPTTLETRRVFTTGQVAKICNVAPRTVGKWFDEGRLRGYRIPGSQDRRIPREHLIRFLKEYGMPLGELEAEIEVDPDAASTPEGR